MFKILFYALQILLWLNLISAEWYEKRSPDIRDLTKAKLNKYLHSLPSNKKYLTDSEVNYAVFDDISEEANRNAEQLFLDYQKSKKRDPRYYVFSNPEVLKEYLHGHKATGLSSYEDFARAPLLRRRIDNEFNDVKPYGKQINDDSLEHITKRIHSSAEDATVRQRKPKYISSSEDKKGRVGKIEDFDETKRTTREAIEKARTNKYSNEKYDSPKRTTRDDKYDYIKPKRSEKYNEDYKPVRNHRSKLRFDISDEREHKKKHSYSRTSIPHHGKKRIYDD